MMPPASGIALGFDRLVMLATGAPRIDEVIWAPGALNRASGAAGGPPSGDAHGPHRPRTCPEAAWACPWAPWARP